MYYCYLFIFIMFFTVTSQSSIKISSYNIRTFDSLHTPTNKKELKKILNGIHPDFLSVQEIVNKESFKKFIKKEMPDYAVYLSRCGGAGKQNIGFVYKKSKFKLTRVFEDTRLSHLSQPPRTSPCSSLRPALVGSFTELKSNKKFIIIGVHLKAGGKKTDYKKRARQYKIIEKIIDELKNNQKNIIIIGDFNTTGYLASDEDYTNFKNMLKSTGSSTSSDNIGCTSYWKGRDRHDQIEESSVLDHILFPKNFLGYNKSKTHLNGHCKKARCAFTSAAELGVSYNEVSDHCPVSLTLY